MLAKIAAARAAGARFLLGCPTGRTPRPVYAAIARHLRDERVRLEHVVLVMMDEYVAPDVERATWSCHHFVATEMRALTDAGASVWFPDVGDPGAYDQRIAAAGGIDLFLLATGASDGHVAFNPPGSARTSRTRVIALLHETRRDNLATFPSFGTLDRVPSRGVSVGIATIAAARAAWMLVTGAGKRDALARIRRATRYDPAWPSTIIHECSSPAICCDAAALAP